MKEWYGTRDHSWGVRRDVGGWEPKTSGRTEGSKASGSLYAWLFFSDSEFTGVWQVQETESGNRSYVDGAITRNSDGKSLGVKEIKLEFEWFPNSSRWTSAIAVVSLASGDDIVFHISPLMPSWAMVGAGYDSGFDDGLGHGVFRGDAYSEHDTYDLSDPEQVVVGDGSVRHPVMRDTPVKVTIGERSSTGYFLVHVRPPLPQYGLQTPNPSN